MSNDLFTETDHWTDDAQALEAEMSIALRPIFDKWVKEGYNIRQISHIATHTVMGLECECVLGAQIKESRRRKNEG
jgi:hypothetical protein